MIGSCSGGRGPFAGAGEGRGFGNGPEHGREKLKSLTIISPPHRSEWLPLQRWLQLELVVDASSTNFIQPIAADLLAEQPQRPAFSTPAHGNFFEAQQSMQFWMVLSLPSPAGLLDV